MSPVELALVNSAPGVPFCGFSVGSNSGGERTAVRQVVQDVAEFGREPKELKDPVTETEVAEEKLARNKCLGMRCASLVFCHATTSSTRRATSGCGAPLPEALPAGSGTPLDVLLLDAMRCAQRVATWQAKEIINELAIR